MTPSRGRESSSLVVDHLPTEGLQRVLQGICRPRSPNRRRTRPASTPAAAPRRRSAPRRLPPRRVRTRARRRRSVWSRSRRNRAGRRTRVARCPGGVAGELAEPINGADVEAVDDFADPVTLVRRMRRRRRQRLTVEPLRHQHLVGRQAFDDTRHDDERVPSYALARLAWLRASAT